MQTDESKKSTPRPLTSTMEDYLEAIVNLEKEKRAVRVKDIAKRLQVRMPTVTSMLKTLDRAGLVNYQKNPTVNTSRTSPFTLMCRARIQSTNFLTDVLFSVS